jgi:Protein of unknown function (DUF3644)
MINMLTEDQQLKVKKQAVEQCVKKYAILRNPEIDDSVIALDCFPKSPSKKLALLVLAYKRQATIEELKRISDQPAGLIRDLREDGFIFKNDGKNNANFLFKNAQGAPCREIVGFKPPKDEIKGKVKSILERSVAACVSAIEIYNKPDFKYREETFSILLVNAWELLLKAKVLATNGNDIRSIQAVDANDEVKKNRAGNPMTIDITNAMQRLFDKKLLDERCKENINLLIEVRDNAIHFINKSADLSRKVQELGTAGLSNYVTAMDEWFGKDLSQYNFYLMPMSFFHLSDLESHSVLGRNRQIENVLKHFREIESQYPPNEDASYNITLRIRTQFVRTYSADRVIEVKYTDDPDAPEVRVSEENIFKYKYPMTYGDLIDKLKNRYADFRPDRRFHSIKKELEDQRKYGERFYKVNYLDVIGKKGSQKKFYSQEILKEFDKHYTKRKAIEQ